MCYVQRPSDGVVGRQGKEQTTMVILNEKPVIALRDTSSTQALVQSGLVQREWQNISAGFRIKCIHGDEREYPTLEVKEHTFFIPVGLVEELP